MCYSNVQEGESYILFMTNFEGALSAKYDDIFGAASDYNDKNEAQVLQTLGEYNFVSLFLSSSLHSYKTMFAENI